MFSQWTPREKVIDQKRRLRKFGMKRHFYDHLDYETSSPPSEHRYEHRYKGPKRQFRAGLTMKDLEGRPELVKQAFSLNNASDQEMHKAKHQRLISIFGTHTLDVGNQAIQAAI